MSFPGLFHDRFKFSMTKKCCKPSLFWGIVLLEKGEENVSSFQTAQNIGPKIEIP